MLFQNYGEKVLIEIDGKKLYFSTTSFGNRKASIEGLKLNYKGVVKEFPDLEGDDNWRVEALRRFKIKIESMTNEEQIANYLKTDLIKYGYIPLYKQKKGFRPEVIK